MCGRGCSSRDHERDTDGDQVVGRNSGEGVKEGGGVKEGMDVDGWVGAEREREREKAVGGL